MMNGANNHHILAGLEPCLSDPGLNIPGFPVIVGPWPFISDLRTGAFTGGSGEEAVVTAGAAQMVNFYGLPSSAGAGMTDAKSPDCQAGFEPEYIDPAIDAIQMAVGIKKHSG